MIKFEVMKELNLGNSDFKDIIENNYYFVDKSPLIEEVIKVQKAVVLLPRPRRFGKTLNLSMLKSFFDKNEKDNQKLFENLEIWKNKKIVEKHFGKYPVIYLTFKDAKAANWERIFKHLKSEIAEIYQKHRYLLDSDELFEEDKVYFKDILSRRGDEIDFEISLKKLSKFLYRFHNQKVVILIDEYDTPIQSGYGNFYEEVVLFMRNLLSGAFKDNSNLYKGIITGILKVSKESIFSGLNNLSVYSILDAEFADKFGFTEVEVKQLLTDFEKKTDYLEIKKWYDGYKFGETTKIYNPWSILNFVVSKSEKFKPYWTNTSANGLIKNEIKKKDAGNIRLEVLKLISNESIVKNIEENFVFSDFKSRKNLFWTLLIFSGYLTTKEQSARKEYKLVIPNYEIKIIFQDTILEWFESDIKVRKSILEKTANYLINNDLVEFEVGFKQIIGDTFSYYDTAKNNEYIYHSYTLGLLAIIGDDYIIKSNKESGEGRYDIMLIPHDKTKNGVVIEIKQIEKLRENESKTEFRNRINSHLQSALNQIDRNKYYTELIENKIDKSRIIKVPVVFAGKEPYITHL